MVLEAGITEMMNKKKAEVASKSLQRFEKETRENLL